MKNICAGIDFGTTNTTAAVYTGGSAPRIIPLENEHQTIPSAIFLPESGGGTFFGRDAMRWYLDGEPGRILRSLKRVLGTDLMKNGTVIAERRLDFRAIIGEFIRHVKNKLDAAAISDVTDVVMGRPVHFRDNDAAGDAAA
ncbi:MAG: hypothetical protein LBR41_01745 [Rickettsiales bacterium]|jgi:hypothetical chaperone protein|nr:hypothetical protein [Rickettsiales bacterium]